MSLQHSDGVCYLYINESDSKNLINFPKGMEQKQIIIRPLIRKKYYEIINYEKKDSFFTIIIIGGSQGAKIFDTLINEILVKISNKHSIKVIHQTSEKNILSLKNFYKENNIENKVFNFDQNLNEFLRQSDLCITRAGASSLAELSLYNIPFIAIPLPTSKDNHQYENAKYYQDKDCCWIVDQNDFDKQKFEELLIKVSSKKDEYLRKKNNLEKLNYQNTWNNVNENLLKIILFTSFKVITVGVNPPCTQKILLSITADKVIISKISVQYFHTFEDPYFRRHSS